MKKQKRCKHYTCDGCQMFGENGCNLDVSICPDCFEYDQWTPRTPPIREKYPVIAIDDIDVETVKRWFQLFMGFSDDSRMKADIRATARASTLNRHLNWEEDDIKPQEYHSCPHLLYAVTITGFP